MDLYVVSLLKIRVIEMIIRDKCFHLVAPSGKAFDKFRGPKSPGSVFRVKIVGNDKYSHYFTV